jgi:type III secretion protein R
VKRLIAGAKTKIAKFKRRWRHATDLEARRNNTQLRVAARAAFILLAIGFVFLLAPEVAQAQKIGGIDLAGSDSVANRPLLLMAALATLSLVPFVGMMVTSFVKIAVVLSITRQAIGTQQAPPTTLITGLAIILTVYVMQPVGLQIYNRTDRLLQVKNADFLDKQNVDLILDAVKVSKEPVKNFLKNNSDEKNRQMFFRVAYRLREPADRLELTPDDFVILMPSFVITELTKAFQIGFIIFVPFLVIDMVVSNILMALGMQMLSPTTISLPFKILLFVLVDGWYMITRGLVLGYH